MRLNRSKDNLLSDSSSKGHSYKTDPTEVEDFEEPDLDSDFDGVEAVKIKFGI
jgi:hypothetical protein